MDPSNEELQVTNDTNISTFFFRVLACPKQHEPYKQDGSRAWLICMAAVLSNILIFGCCQTYGIIFPVLLDEFGEGKAKTAWVGSLALALSMSFSPLAAKIVDRFGARPVTIGGGLAAALGLFVTSQVNSINIMFFTYSIIFGFGSSCANISGFEIVLRYFKKRIALATGVMQAGAGASIFVMSPVIEILLTTFGWRWAFIAMGGLVCIVCVCGCFYNPHVEQESETHELRRNRNQFLSKRREDGPLQNRSIIICSFSSFLNEFGNSIPLLHLARYAQDIGVQSDQAAALYVGYGVMSMIGRILCGRICDLKFSNPIYIYCLAAFTTGVSTLLCPLANDFSGLMTYFCINGFGNGSFVTSAAVIIMRVTLPRQRTRAFGAYFFVVSLGFASGPPFGGFLADQLGSYIAVFFTAGSISLLAAFLILAIKCFKQQHEPLTENSPELVAMNSFSQLMVFEKVTVL